MSFLSAPPQTRIFDWKAQNDFAFFSGDHNPLHVDPVAARRTQAGRAAVHGMHAVLWALDALAHDRVLNEGLAQIEVDFRKLIYVGDEVAVEITRQDRKGIRFQLKVAGLIVTSFKLVFGQATGAADQPNVCFPVPEPCYPRDPTTLSLHQMRQARGRLTFAPSLGSAADFFPALAAAIDAKRVAALACMSRLVGMICPGLHSMFSGFELATAYLASSQDAMSFQVTRVDERFRLVTQSVEGGGWLGTIQSFARVPPVAQPSVEHFAKFVRHNEFKDSRALIVGGSRGLGELTAKLIAAGGGGVTITYAVGRTEALSIQRQIREWGGECEILQYDATKLADHQLGELKRFPTSFYYFATPPMARRTMGLYSQPMLNDFLRFYVDGFHGVLQQLSAMSDAPFAAFYPSSVAVEQRPAEMTEYAMAKAAGEVLCTDLARFGKGLQVVVERLPRMLTDLTATVFPVETADPLPVMLSVVRRVENRNTGPGPL